jgi:hypothetical protein
VSAMTRYRFFKSLVGVLALAGCGSVSGNPIITTYTDEASFLAAVAPGYFQNDWPGYGNGQILSSPQPFSGGSGPFSYSASSPGNFFGASTGFGNGFPDFSSDFSNNSLTFTSTSGNITAEGGFFSRADVNNFFVAGSLSLTLNVSGGTNPSLEETLTVTSGGPVFFGATVTGGTFTSLVLPAAGAFGTVNDPLIVGMAADAEAVPEPSTIIMGGFAGLMGIGYVWRRRRAR